MKKAVKTIGTFNLTAVIVALFSVNVSAQPPGPMGPGPGMGIGPGKMMMDHMKMMDQDGDGKLSQQEFIAFHEKRFQQMDTSGDGYLDTQEFTSGMTATKRNMKGGMLSAPAR